MALIIRIDVDRPYGRQSILRQTLSRISSDYYFPKIQSLGYLADLKIILETLNKNNAKSYIFFRRCSLPSPAIMKLIDKGQHKIGLHLENSRTYETFYNELKYIEDFYNRKVDTFSKHGSGKFKYGFHHYPHYEPQKYIEWGEKAGMEFFFGNSEDPTCEDFFEDNLHVFPSAFWLEPYYRRTDKFNIEWLQKEIKKRDVVLLFHPDNITVDPSLLNELSFILKKIPTKILN